MVPDFLLPAFLRLGEYMVSTKRCHMPHNSVEYDFIATKERDESRNFLPWRYQLAVIMRFDTIRLFLCGYVKDRIYADKPSTLNHLKISIRQVMAERLPNMCQKVVKN